MPPTSLPYFASCAPGLEPVLLAELRALRVAGARAEEGGVAFGGGERALYAANLHLRTASRVLVRVATFHADSFAELERRAGKVEWERFVGGAGEAVPVGFRVTCRKSRLYHSDAVAERLLRAVGRRVGGDVAAAGGAGEADDADDGDAASTAPGQLFVVRLVRDELTLSADASGALLHRRGYRQAVGKAPLRETLAAAMLLGAGWTPERPLLDPMCGAGTIAIEAAMIARGIAPGLARAGRADGFAFTRWPGADRALWERLTSEAAAAVRDTAERTLAPILAGDRDAGAVAATIANAERAGVAGAIDVAQRTLSALPALPAGGWIVTNPPYGGRVGERGPLRALYARLGEIVAALDDWSLALLSADPVLEGQLALPLVERWRTTNGGIPVRLLAYQPE